MYHCTHIALVIDLIGSSSIDTHGWGSPPQEAWWGGGSQSVGQSVHGRQAGSGNRKSSASSAMSRRQQRSASEKGGAKQRQGHSGRQAVAALRLWLQRGRGEWREGGAMTGEEVRRNDMRGSVTGSAAGSYGCNKNMSGGGSAAAAAAV
jgi:hypothetical protein